MCVYLITTTTQNVVNSKTKAIHSTRAYVIKHMKTGESSLPPTWWNVLWLFSPVAPVALSSLLGRHKEPP